MSRERALVELVNEAGRVVGSTTVAQAHTAPGQLHRAFSVLVLDNSGRLLLQRRSAAKTRFPLRWANACCGHPAPGEPVPDAGTRRLAEELGLTGLALTELGVYVYRAADPQTGLVEHEYDHVLLGRTGVTPALVPDPAEVAGLRWLGAGALPAAVEAEPDSYAPWLLGVARLLVTP